MIQLAKWTIMHRDIERTIELLRGNLAELPREHSVDVLVVSAFANDYTLTPTSLIGSLFWVGISVEELAKNKEIDLREQFSCWLSHKLADRHAFGRILCVESGWRGSAPEITDDLFRALSPYLLTSLPNASVAMPLVGAGDQGWPPAQMMETILNATIAWINRGLPLRLLKIVVRSEETAKSALDKFIEIQHRQESAQRNEVQGLLTCNCKQEIPCEFDLFMSYCHKDLDTAQTILAEI